MDDEKSSLPNKFFFYKEESPNVTSDHWDFELPTQDDEALRLRTVLEEAQSTVLVSFRGHW